MKKRIITVTSVKKYSALLLLAVFSLSNLTTVQAFVVDSITKPSVPEFTLRIISNPYDVPPKTTIAIDEYTGKETTTTQPGYHVETKSIEIIIKNQPFTPYNLTKYTVYDRDRENFSRIQGISTYNKSKRVNFYYNIEVKGYFGDNWHPVENKYSKFEGPEPNAQLDSPHTVISIGADYPNDAVLDFRVQARIGYYNPYGPAVEVIGYDFYGQESEWSNIQTLNISSPSQTTESPANETSQILQPTAIIGTVLAVVIVSVVSLIYFKKCRHKTSPHFPVQQ
jgi:hypothetical protein